MNADSAATERRRLACVLFLDIVGYSNVMNEDESRASKIRKFMESIVTAEVNGQGGRLVKFLGDGALAEFASAGTAVECA